mmetsp:Transcript_62147/g.74778  ORF Transcript_62147/g.74778 Transcript_62147/m.74778 type:complete len:480 (-) Transcript_62147:548-1987(-)
MWFHNPVSLKTVALAAAFHWSGVSSYRPIIPIRRHFLFQSQTLTPNRLLPSAARLCSTRTATPTESQKAPPALQDVPTPPSSVRCIPAKEFELAQYYTPTSIQPLLIADVFNDTKTTFDNIPYSEKVCERLLFGASNLSIDVQRKSRVNGKLATTLHEASFEEAIDWMMSSHHDDSFFAFCEGLLDGAYPLHYDENEQNQSAQDEVLQELQLELDDLKRSFLAKQLSHNRASLNLFDYFPEEQLPSDCIILAGEGATSTLHRDPFEWTGTSLCLEGSKIWRFIAPPDNDEGVTLVDKRLHSYRLDSVAWEKDHDGSDGSIPLSSGWQSDHTLYARHAKNSIPSARELSDMDDCEKQTLLQSIAANLGADALHPDFNLGELGLKCHVVVQNAGDLLLIPPHWWHQTYALEPSISVASQWCDARYDGPRVIRHILDCTGTSQDAPELLVRHEERTPSVESVQTTVKALFAHLNTRLGTISP